MIRILLVLLLATLRAYPISTASHCAPYHVLGVDEPSWVTAHRLAIAIKTDLPPAKAADRKPDGPAEPQGTPLTTGTLETLPGGRYDFVRLDGEHFLRVAPAGTLKHLRLGAGRKALVAGELMIGLNTVEDFCLQSGTYMHSARAGNYVPLALWDQGIYPSHIRIYSSSSEMIERAEFPIMEFTE